MVQAGRYGAGLALLAMWVSGPCGCTTEADSDGVATADPARDALDASMRAPPPRADPSGDGPSDASPELPSNPTDLPTPEATTPNAADAGNADTPAGDVANDGGSSEPDVNAPGSNELDASAPSPAGDAQVPGWLLVRPEIGHSDELIEPFGAADGQSYEEATCTRENAECLRTEARDEWLDLAETLGAEATARAGYLTELRIPPESSERYFAWLVEAVGELPTPGEAAEQGVVEQVVVRVARALFDRWPTALHKTSAEFDEEVTSYRAEYTVNDEVEWMYDQKIDGIQTTGYYLGYGTVDFESDWRLRSFVLPTPSAPLRAWVERHGPLPTLDEVRSSVLEQLPVRYPSDYDPIDFGTHLAPDVIDYSEVEVRGPYWYWGDRRWTYQSDFEYWRVVYTVVVYFDCEDYLFTKLRPFTESADAGASASYGCRDGPGEE